jgi:DNA-binding MurR/RpiR family transcriptional regulator
MQYAGLLRNAKITLKQLVEQTGLSRTTVVRLKKALGLSGLTKPGRPKAA